MTASAPALSMVLLVLVMAIWSDSSQSRWSGCGENRGPHRVVRRDEQHVSVAAAEGEVDGAGKLDLADEIAVRREDLHPAERGRVDATLRIHLDPVREPRGGDAQEALVRK